MKTLRACSYHNKNAKDNKMNSNSSNTDKYDRKIYEKLCESFKNHRKYNIMINTGENK